MGQYYNIAVVSEDYNTKNKVASAGKLSESGEMGSPLINGIYNLLLKKKRRIYFVGDYYKTAKDNIPSYKEIDRLETIKISNFEFNCKGKYLVNYDKQYYIDLQAYENFYNKKKCEIVDFENYYCVFASIAVLTALGNGMGCGDYYGNKSYCAGTWAGDLLGIVNKKELEKLDYTNFNRPFISCYYDSIYE